MSTVRPGNRVGLGCELLGGTDWGTVDVDEALAAVRCAWEHGVEVFDTADVYGLGLSETRLAEALGSSRHQATIVSKFGVRWEETDGRATTCRDNSPGYVATAVEASLRRLRVERIPVYLVHWPDGTTPLDDVVAALLDQQDRGKIGAFGVSNFDRASMLAAGDSGATVVELPLSLVDRNHLEDFTDLSARGVSTIAYGVLAQGLLTGKYDSATRFDSDDRRHRLPQFESALWQENETILAALRHVADELDARPSEVALAWVLRQAVDVALFGARTPDHVISALRGAELSATLGAGELLDRLTMWRAEPGHLECRTNTEPGRGRQ